MHFAFRQLRPHRCRGFTMIELVMALTITGMLLLGMTSIMMLSGKASSSASRQLTGDMRALLDQMREDAAAAISIQQLAAKSITFTVPDRTGDGLSEQVSYDWTDTATTGGMVRVFNGARQSIAMGASAFVLTPTIDTQTLTATTTSAETLLFRRTPLLTPLTYTVGSTQSCGQRITPVLPASAVSWCITRVRLPLRSVGFLSGVMRVQVRAAISGLPGLVLDETTLNESNLPASFDFREFTFDRVATSQAPSASACFVLLWKANGDSADVAYETLSAALSDGRWVSSTNGGSTWTSTALRSMALDVYGTYDTSVGTTVSRVTALTIDVTPREPALQSALRTTIRLRSTPEVPA